MKLLLLILTISALIACRKEEPATAFDNIKLMKSTCLNGILDEDEDFIDCGEKACIPCHKVEIPCKTSPLKLTFSNNDSITFTSSQIIRDTTSDGLYQITAQSGTKKVVIVLANMLFNSAANVGEVTNSLFYVQKDNNRFYVTYTNGNNEYQSGYGAGNCYIHYLKDKITVDFCNVNIRNSYTTFNLAGNLSIPK
jgi:hypothetical protein